MNWFLGALCLVLSLVVVRLLRERYVSKTTNHAAEEIEPWKQVLRSVQMHMHTLCLYREAILEHLKHTENDELQELENRLVCEIAEHMSLVRRAHQLFHEPDAARKQTDPEIVIMALQQRSVESEELCAYIAERISVKLPHLNTTRPQTDRLVKSKH